ncbi:NlpC/P60 family protein [Paenibacillus ferrarius]|uniref:C40 family peptidase n=1 Tax=Paenibacillus ferrarius TaxID=1469647 RepID=UPI003D2DB232
MWRIWKAAAAGGMVVVLLTVTACGKDGARPSSTPSPTTKPKAQSTTNGNSARSLSRQGGGIIAQGTNEDAVIPIKVIGSTNYIPVSQLIQTLNYKSNWEDGHTKLQIGDNDANFELIMNTNKAVKDGAEIQLGHSVVQEGDNAYLPVSAVGDLFQDDMSFEVRNQELRIHPSTISTPPNEDAPDPAGTSPDLDFSDDPADPFRGDENAEALGSQLDKALPAWTTWGNEQDIPVLKNVNVNAMIQKGKQYLGVKYLFGTGPYPKTGRFDCSTFTQYVYGKYGVSLPRVARQQGTRGNLVSRKSLRKGDLMFFYVPGRFKSNRTVGHVGIYIGNMRMLHASPEPKNGVQITDINKAYWKKTFLKAKRIVY